MSSTYKERLSDFTPYLIQAIALGSTCAFTSGLDMNWWGGILGLPYFNATFGTAEFRTVTGISYKSLSSTQQAIGSFTGAIGGFVGALIAGVTARALGPRLGFVHAAAWLIGGSIVEITCSIGGDRYWQLVAGKIVVAIGAGMNGITSITYLSQCTTSRSRGMTLNTIGLFIAFGSLAASLVVYGVSKTTGRIQWLLPIGLQFIVPVLQIAWYPFMPESPVWLVQKGRTQEAMTALTKFRSNRSPLQVEAELREMQILANRSEPKLTWKAISALLKGDNRKRTLTTLGISSFSAAQGLSFLINYVAILLVQIGFQDVFLIIVIIYVLTVVCTAAGFTYQDTLGRRLALLTGSIMMAICMLGFSIVATIIPQLGGAAGKGCVALIILWAVSFTSTWNAVQNTVLSEVPTSGLQEVTIALTMMWNQVVTIIVIVTSPYLQNPTDANLGPKIGYIYGGISVCAVVYIYFMLPELKGRSPVEIDWLYEHKISPRKMGGYTVPQADEMRMRTSAGRHDENDSEVDFTATAKEEAERVEFADQNPMA